MSIRPRRARPCAFCQRERVIVAKICDGCMERHGEHLNEPWAKFAIAESDQTARLIRRKNAHEVSLEGRFVVL